MAHLILQAYQLLEVRNCSKEINYLFFLFISSLLKKQVTVLALVCAPCFYSKGSNFNTWQQGCVSVCAKGTCQPSLQDRAASKPWPPCPASTFQRDECCCQQRKIACLQNILTGGSCEQGKLHSDLQICSTPACLI